MKTKVRVETQVEEFVKALAPEPRRRLRLAIRALADDSGDIKSLEGSLAGFNRLRISGHRVIFAERIERGSRIIECLFAERRALVYELFAKLLVEQTGA
jgi:mRNA-degrading endonuclease RelE of RelBE toxin-antitoxin system